MDSPSESPKWGPEPSKRKCVFSTLSKFYDCFLKAPKESHNDVIWGVTWVKVREKELDKQRRTEVVRVTASGRMSE